MAPYGRRGDTSLYRHCNHRHLRHNCPADHLITYYNPKPKEKYDDVNDEITRRIRGTIGGDRINYPGIVTAATADATTVRSLLHSVISDRHNHGTNTRFTNLDIIDFFLDTDLTRPEFVSIPRKFIPDDILTKYNLRVFIRNDAILFQVDKNIYGLPQATYLSNRHLVRQLATHGYLEDPIVLCLFTNASNGIQFTLILDDFGVKYSSSLPSTILSPPYKPEDGN